MEQSRRRLVGRSLMVVAWAYATFVSIYVLSSAFGADVFWSGVPGGVKAIAVIFGVLVLVLDGLWVILFVRDLFRREATQYLLSRTKEGTARISLRAIQASLLRRARELDEVIGARVSVRRPAEKKLRVDVAYTTTEDRNAILVSESLRRALRDRFEELVKAEDDFTVEFDVKIDGFVPPNVTPRPGPEEETEDREPFTGPRYPID
jgi:hypothetical protein